MPLVNTATIVKDAHRRGFGIPQVNTNGGNYELTRAIVETAEELQAPVILGAYEKNLAFRGFKHAAMVMRWFGERATVPVAIHLDHGSTVEACREAIEAGFTSVMIDGSHLPIDENIAQTAEVSVMARSAAVGIEAEVGELQRLGPDGSMGEVKNLSAPEEVQRLCKEADVDMVAVGIGNAHGFYKGAPNIRLDLLETLAQSASVPLVLHGTTGIPDDVVAACVAQGMAKVNLGTLIRTRCVQYTAAIIAEDAHQNHPWRVAAEVVERMKPHVRHILEVTGAAGRAASTCGTSTANG